MTLSLSFQYQLLPEQMLALYHDFGAGEDAYAVVFFDVATHLVAEAAASYTAYEFFNERMTIAADMQERLDRVCQERIDRQYCRQPLSEPALVVAYSLSATLDGCLRQHVAAARAGAPIQRAVLLTVRHVVRVRRAVGARAVSDVREGFLGGYLVARLVHSAHLRAHALQGVRLDVAKLEAFVIANGRTQASAPKRTH